MRNRVLYIFLIFIVINISSCNFEQRECSNENANDTLLTKTVIFPNSLLQLEANKFKKVDSIKTAIDGKIKIISIIDGNCRKCIINQLNSLDSIFNNILYNDNKLIFILNVNKSDSAFFMRNFSSAINAKGIILWDNYYNFERENKLLTSNINLRTFMVNSENKIILYGNPIFHPKLIGRYQEYLEK